MEGKAASAKTFRCYGIPICTESASKRTSEPVSKIDGNQTSDTTKNGLAKKRAERVSFEEPDANGPGALLNIAGYPTPNLGRATEQANQTSALRTRLSLVKQRKGKRKRLASQYLRDRQWRRERLPSQHVED
jgi:hypothetical protein